jgi:imidazole glycerol-phosphate synthase subunit HisH
MIVIVDYGMGNLGSIKNMFKHLRVEAAVSADPEVIASADKLVLPGVGHFDHGMRQIKERGLREVLDRRALQDKIPVLGICLGMQLLLESSEEGAEAGLGWVKGRVVRFDAARAAGKIRVPHMGWNVAKPIKESPLTDGLGSDPRFYFVHSFHAADSAPADALLITPYGYEFVSGLQSANLYGVQFHPEKSHRFGLRLLQNFARC